MTDEVRYWRYLLFMSNDIDHHEWHHAVNTRDAAYDGVFVVALTSTRVYCRPVCPSRLARPEHRRFFPSYVEADAAGYRACKRCRPELRSGESPLEAVQRLAHDVVQRIPAAALAGHSITELASTVGTSERHMRRVLDREIGVTPKQLVQAQRLRCATELLVNPQLSISHVAYASGFHSVRRFNAVFRSHLGMSPSAWRRERAAG
jgi:AraC family transcriptional regulator of adaptative response / DNA-3-methyladenine glycosylase II